MLEGLWVGSVAVGHTLHVLYISSIITVLYFPTQATHTWYLVSNVLQTPVSNIIATRNGIKPLDDMMAVVSERKIAVVGKEECYRGTRRYITVSRPRFKQRGGCEVETGR